MTDMLGFINAVVRRCQYISLHPLSACPAGQQKQARRDELALFRSAAILLKLQAFCFFAKHFKLYGQLTELE